MSEFSTHPMVLALDPLTREWFLHSQDPVARFRREQFKILMARELKEAEKRQALIKKHVLDKEEHNGKNVRRIGIVDPVYHRDLQEQHRASGGDGNYLEDKDFLED